jgi:hypothetical protein
LSSLFSRRNKTADYAAKLMSKLIPTAIPICQIDSTILNQISIDWEQLKITTAAHQ